MRHSLCLIYSLSAALFLTACGGSKNVSRSDSPSFEHELLGKRTEEGGKKIPPTKAVKAKSSGALESFVSDWAGTPHRMGGTTKKGVDCSGFVIVAYREVFEQHFSTRRAQDLFTETTPLEREELEYGDLVFFKIRGRRIDHVGIYLYDNQFAHVSSSRGVMISSLDQNYFHKRFFKGGRFLSK